MELNQVTLSVTKLERSIEFYRKLGLHQIVESPRYARFECRPGGPSLSLHEVEAVSPDPGVTVYFECADLDERVAELRAQGMEWESDPVDQPWLWREAHVRDPDGHRICFYFAGENRLNPPWRLS